MFDLVINSNWGSFPTSTFYRDMLAAYMIGDTGGAYIFLTLLWACLILLSVIAAVTLPFVWGAIVSILIAWQAIVGSNFIKNAFGISGNVSLQQVLLAVADVIAQIALGAGLLGLSVVAGVPTSVLLIAAIFILVVMIMIDYIIFFYSRKRRHNQFISKVNYA